MDLEGCGQAREQDQNHQRQDRRELRARNQSGEYDAGQHDDRDDVPTCARGQVPQQGASSIATGSDLRVVVAAGGVRLDRFLAEADQLGSRSRASKALERGKVFVNDREATPADAGRRLEDGDRVRSWMDRPGSARRRWGRAGADGELRILYQDSALIVVNKPAGVLTVPLPAGDHGP